MTLYTSVFHFIYYNWPEEETGFTIRRFAKSNIILTFSPLTHPTYPKPLIPKAHSRGLRLEHEPSDEEHSEQNQPPIQYPSKNPSSATASPPPLPGKSLSTRDFTPDWLERPESKNEGQSETMPTTVRKSMMLSPGREYMYLILKSKGWRRIALGPGT